ncbi:MAG: chemotaxis protein CheX [Ignavibacteriales bacterium]
MNVEYINPFIEASQLVLKTVAGIDITLGKIFIKNSPYNSDSVVIIIGITGKIRGQVIFTLNKRVALKICSNMMGGMEIAEFDEIAKSAVSEMTNMILGNTATILFNRGIQIDITPPSLLMGDSMQISSNKMKTVCVPLYINETDIFEIDVALDETLEDK